MNEKHFIVYHKNCPDGLASAAIVNYYLGETVEKVFFPANYGDVFDPDNLDKDTTLWILDFSFPMPIMWEMNDKAKKIIWIDHHPTAIMSVILEEKLNNVERHLDTKKAACRLTWESLFPDKEVPYIIDIAEDRDMWWFKLPQTRAVTEAMYYDIKEPTDIKWLELLSDGGRAGLYIQEYSVQGQGLLKAKKHRVEKAVKRGYYGSILGKRAFYVNSAEDISEIGEEIYMSHPDPIVAVIYHYEGYNGIKFSLRSNTIDVSKIAQELGGGGHVYSAGFTLDFVANGKVNDILKNVPERW